MDIKNFAQLEKYLTQLAKDAMEEVGSEAEKVVREQIEEDVYQSYSPKEYERTYELKNSLVHTQPKQNGDVVETEIKHETNLIGSYTPNQHRSVVDGSSSVDNIAEIVHDGRSGLIFGEGEWTQPRPYMSNAKDKIEGEGLHIKAMKKALKKRGVKIE